MLKIYYRHSYAAIICYDPLDLESFQSIKYWIQELQKVSDGIKIYICATKQDIIEAKKKVEIEKIKKLYKDKSLLFFDSSIVIEMEKNSGYDFNKLSFTSFKNRDEVLECITSIW